MAMHAAEIANWEERRLVEQVRALRYLPPGTWLPEPRYQPDRDLLTDLLRLQVEMDTLQWLKESHGSLTARVLLWTVLDRIWSSMQAVRLAIRAGQEDSLGEYQQWLGDLLDLPEDAEPFRRLINTHPTTITPELLRSVFQMLRGKSLARPAVEAIGDEILLLLDNLFRLPETTDPLQWIETEHSRLAAVETLRHVLAQIWPPRPLLVGHTMGGQVMKVHHPNIRLHAAGLSVTLHEVTLGKAGFALTLQARIPERLLPIPSDLPGRGIKWQGIERVVDDLGYHYLVPYRLEEGVKRWPGWFEQSLQLVCYPVPAPTVTEITVSSNAMSFVVVGLRPKEQRRRVFHHVPLGDLTWHVRVAG